MGKVISLRTRRNIEAQGFLGLDDFQIAQLDGWLRFSPLVCLTWTAVGLWLASPVVIAALVPFALLGGILKGHPFDVVYNYGLRYLTGGPRIPSYGKPRKFGCLMASVILTLTALAFYAGFPAAGYALGGLMAVLASVNVATGFCVPSFTYAKIFRPVRRTGTVRSAG
ncbi:MAG TPA: DUF4395 family protein [Aridibacter sp.]|nr:DUF4395 family protein [Aridibacter sp.]